MAWLFIALIFTAVYISDLRDGYGNIKDGREIHLKNGKFAIKIMMILFVILSFIFTGMKHEQWKSRNEGVNCIEKGR